MRQSGPNSRGKAQLSLVWSSAASDEAPRAVKAVRVWFPRAAQTLIGILRSESK